MSTRSSHEPPPSDMGRRRSQSAAIPLPEGVHRVPSGKRVYYYWNPGRGTWKESKGIRIFGDPTAEPGHPEYIRFHRELAAAAGTTTKAPAGSVAAVVDLYRNSSDFKDAADATRASYDVSLRRFENADGWGHLPAGLLSPAAVLAARDAMKDTPVMANQMLSVGSTLWAWAIPLNHIKPGVKGGHVINPFEAVKPLQIEDRGHIPWPQWAIEHVIAHGPADLARMVKLGLMTCQRESDLVRMGPEQRQDQGIWCRPQKTQRRKRAFRIPLRTVDAMELDRWAEAPIRFHNPRWKAPIERWRADLYIYSPKGEPYNPSSLRARWHRWLKTPAGAALCKEWVTYLERQVRRFAWDIDPEERDSPTIHGLRGAGILLRRLDGYEIAQIANDVGMSPGMVERYMRFRDQVEVGEAGRRRLEIVSPRG